MNAKRGYYSLVQFCPNPARAEAVNVGVILFCPEAGFLAARTSAGARAAAKLVGREGVDPAELEAAKQAIIAPGLHLAFANNQTVTLDGRTIAGETARRDIRVCGAGAFVVLKALAFHIRGEKKDAYDLFYLLRNYGGGVADVAAQLRPLIKDVSTKKALAYMREDFQESESIGPRRVAEFLFGRPEVDTQADALGFVRRLLAECRA